MKHYIIVKWKDAAQGETSLPAIRELFQKTLALDGVNCVELHCSNSDRTNRHDLMIEMQLTPEGLAAFDSSQMHRDWKDLYGYNIEHKAIFDCE